MIAATLQRCRVQPELLLELCMYRYAQYFTGIRVHLDLDIP